MKNKVLAIPTAPAAMPVKPNIPAIIAITRNIAAHLSIILFFRVINKIITNSITKEVCHDTFYSGILKINFFNENFKAG